uniref:Altered inheritance of mitochondria protein 3-like n=1 Tax=Crassostrea virginica TaxID=6565 RepID=A0A8B8EEI5_CRAVI|nr:altered inheritance of mitochondria protein 3-like [Crassostrea virginica]
MELGILCLLCVLCLVSGQSFPGTGRNTFQQSSQLSMPHRLLSAQHHDPRLMAQMSVANRPSTGMPGNSLMPITQVTQAPGIQRRRLGSPHHQASTKAPPVSLLQFLLDTTPAVPQEVTSRSNNASPHRTAPPTMGTIPRSPFRSVQSPGVGQAGQSQFSTRPGQISFSQNQFNTPNNRQNSNLFSSNAFRNPQSPQSTPSQRMGNMFSSQSVQQQMMSRNSNPSVAQSMSSPRRPSAQQQQFFPNRIGQTQPTQRPLTQQQWNPAASPHVQPQSSTNSFQNSRVQQQLSPRGVDHSQVRQNTIQTTPQNRNVQTQNTWQSQHQPSSNVRNTLNPLTPGRLGSVSTINSNKNQPSGVQQHSIHVKSLQPLPSNEFQNNPPYQNVAAHRTEPRQMQPQYTGEPKMTTTSTPIYNIRANTEPKPQASSLNSLSSRIDQQSSNNVLQNQPYSRTEPNGVKHALEQSQLSSLNIVRSLPATHSPWSQRTTLKSSTNIHRSLPDVQQDTTQRNANAHTPLSNTVRNLPSIKSAIPERMEHFSPNIVRTLPIDQQDSLIKQEVKVTPPVSVPNPLRPASQSRPPQGMRWKQNQISNSPTTQPTPQEAITERNINLQQPSINKQQSAPMKQRPRVTNTNTNPLDKGQQSNSNLLKKTGLIPTVINGKKYMINPNFVELLKGLLSKAGLDMKTDSFGKTAQTDNVRVTNTNQDIQPQSSHGNHIGKVASNRPSNNQRNGLPSTMLQTQSDYEPPVMKQRIVKDHTSTPGIKTVAYTNLGTIGQTKLHGEAMNHRTQSSQNDQVTTQPNSPYQAIRMTSKSPNLYTVPSSSQMMTSVTVAPRTETIRFTNPTSLMTKLPQTIPTTTPFPATTPVPRRRKALLLPFRDVPNTTPKPVVKTTIRPTPAPQNVSPNLATTDFAKVNSVTPPPRNFLIGTTKSVGNTAQVLTPRYLSDRRTTSTVTTLAPTTRLVMGTQQPINFLETVTKPTSLSTIPYNNALDPTSNPLSSKPKSLLPESFFNSDPFQTLNAPKDQAQNNGIIEQVSEQTPLQTQPDPTEKTVNVQFGFNLGHFRHNQSKKDATKHSNSDGSVINDIYSRRSDGLHVSPSVGTSVHKGFVGFNNRANNVELLVLR